MPSTEITPTLPNESLPEPENGSPPSRFISKLSLGLILGVLFFPGAPTQAQTSSIWITETIPTGGTVDWSNPAKWGGTAPAPGTVNLDFSNLTVTTYNLSLRNDIAGTFNVSKWILPDAARPVSHSSTGTQTINFVQVDGFDPEIIHDSSRSFPAHQTFKLDSIGITGTGTVLQMTGTAVGNSTLYFTSTVFTGEGGINVNKAGRVSFDGASTFTGDFTLTSGEVILAVSTTGPANNVTTGPLGLGAVNLNGGILQPTNDGSGARVLGNSLRIGGNFQVATSNGSNQSITFAGTTVLSGTGATRTITGGFSGAEDTDKNTLTFSGAIIDDGAGNGLAFNLGDSDTKIVLSGSNTYTGNTTVNGNASNSLTLSETGSLTFAIGADGVNNQIVGDVAFQLDGSFIFNLADADTTLGSNWNIVNTATHLKTFGSTFNVTGFTDNLDNTWAATSGGITYTFFEDSGRLQVTAIPEPSVWLLLAAVLAAATYRRASQ